MNRAFILVLVPGLLAAAGYFMVAAVYGVRLAYARIIGAVVGAIAALLVVHFYYRRKAAVKK